MLLSRPLLPARYDYPWFVDQDIQKIWGYDETCHLVINHGWEIPTTNGHEKTKFVHPQNGGFSSTPCYQNIQNPSKGESLTLFNILKLRFMCMYVYIYIQLYVYIIHMYTANWFNFMLNKPKPKWISEIQQAPTCGAKRLCRCSISGTSADAGSWKWWLAIPIEKMVISAKGKIMNESSTILVGGWATPLKNMSSSIGMISNPIYAKIKNVPNNQPV